MDEITNGKGEIEMNYTIEKIGHTAVTIREESGYHTETMPAIDLWRRASPKAWQPLRLSIDPDKIDELNAAVRRCREVERRMVAAMQACGKHAPEQKPERGNYARGYSGSVAEHPYTDEEPRAHGGIRYTERCTRCHAEREVNHNQGWSEYGTWHAAPVAQ